MRLAAILFLAMPALAQAQAGTCYETGQGPIMMCFEGGRQVTVRKHFMHRGQLYAWDHQMRSYCYRNEYGNPHCMQIGQVNSLRCSEGKGKQLSCD